MNAHKYLAIFLAALLLTASACESSDASISDSTEYSSSDTSAASEDTAPIERCNYNGEEFHIYAPNWGGLMAVPVIVGNPEMVGKACELLAFYSEDTTIPAYYDLMLGEKLARDNNSKEMLELIFENVFYDPGLYFFSFGKTQKLIHTIKNIVVLQQSDAIASHYSSVETAAKAEISTFCDNVLALDEYN